MVAKTTDTEPAALVFFIIFIVISVSLFQVLVKSLLNYYIGKDRFLSKWTRDIFDESG